MLKIVKYGAKGLAKYGHVVKITPKIEWTEPQAREVVKRQVLRVSKDPKRQKKRLVNIGSNITDRQGNINQNVENTIMQNFEPVATRTEGRLTTHPRQMTAQGAGGERIPLETEFGPKMHDPMRENLPIDEARKVFYDQKREGQDLYHPSTKTQSQKRIQDAEPGSYGKDWRTDPNSPIVGPEIPAFGKRKELVGEKQVPVDTPKGYGDYVETLSAVEGLTNREYAEAIWRYMGPRSSGSKVWKRMLEEQAPKKMPVGKDAHGKEVFMDKKDILDKPQAGFNYFLFQFLQWRDNPKTYGVKKIKKVGQKQRPITEVMDYQKSAKNLMQQMWDNYEEGLKAGVVK